jgi:hypothetical protein
MRAVCLSRRPSAQPIRRSSDPAHELTSGTHRLLVLSGTFHDSYTANTTAFVRSRRSSNKVQIDHVVPLTVWLVGAQWWSPPWRTT